MRKFVVLLCTLMVSGATLSAQSVQNVDSKAVETKNETPVRSVDYMRAYRANVELSWNNSNTWGISTSHGYSFGNGLYVSGGFGFEAELTRKSNALQTINDDVDPEFSYTPESKWNAAYYVPVFADVKYSFTKSLATPFVSFKGGVMADITNSGIRTFANPAVGIDIERVTIKAGYEYQLGCWGHLNGKHLHMVKLGIGYTF